MGLLLAGAQEQCAVAVIDEKLLQPGDLPGGGGPAHLPGDWPGRHLAEPSAGQRLPVHLCVCPMAGGRGTGRHVAGVRYFRPALGAGAVDDQQHDGTWSRLHAADYSSGGDCPGGRRARYFPRHPRCAPAGAGRFRLLRRAVRHHRAGYLWPDSAAAPSVYLRLCRRGDWRGDHCL